MRSHTADFISWFKRWWAPVGGVAGVVGWLSSVLAQGLQDPLWTWMLFWAGTSVLLVITALSFLLRENLQSPITDASGGSIVRSRPVVPNWIQYSLLCVFFCSPVVACLLARQPHNAFSALFVDHVEVVYEGVAAVDGKLFYRGQIVENDGLDEDGKRFFLSNAFYVKCAVSKAHRFPRVGIEKVFANVVEYVEKREPPKYGAPQVMPLREDNLYLIAIGTPSNTRAESFQAEQFFERNDGGRHEAKRFAARVLEDEHPESIVVRVDSVNPGIYTFDLMAEVSAGTRREIVRMGRFVVFFPDFELDRHGSQ